MATTLNKKLLVAVLVGLVMSLTACDGTLILSQIVLAQNVCQNHAGLVKATSVRESRVVAYCGDGTVINAPVPTR